MLEFTYLPNKYFCAKIFTVISIFNIQYFDTNYALNIFIKMICNKIVTCSR